MSSTVGRPRRVSRELLQEAAFELFQLRGYRGTSVEEIARTAGFSRATFFNVFASKAELFWLETDRLIAGLADELERRGTEPAPPRLAAVVVDYGGRLSGADVPWALQNAEVIEAESDLAASGASRVLAIERLFERYLEQRAERLGLTRAQPERRAEAAVITGLLLAAVRAWIDAGVARGDLRASVERALAVLTEPLS